MSDTSEAEVSEALPRARSGIGIGTIFRLLAIALGIMSATLMVVDGFDVPINQAFMEVLEGVRELVGTIIWPFEKLIVVPIVVWLHEQGFAFNLGEHWKNVFVLLWLFMGAFARTWGGIFDWSYWAFVWFIASLCSLVAGVLAGTVPLEHPAIVWWSGAGYYAFIGMENWFRLSYFQQRRTRSDLLFPLGSIALAALFVALAVELIPSPETHKPWTGLGLIATVIGGLGTMFLLLGAFDRRGHGDTFLQQWLGDPWGRIGLDISFVLGTTAIIVYVAHLLA